MNGDTVKMASVMYDDRVNGCFCAFVCVRDGRKGREERRRDKKNERNRERRRPENQRENTRETERGEDQTNTERRREKQREEKKERKRKQEITILRCGGLEKMGSALRRQSSCNVSACEMDE